MYINKKSNNSILSNLSKGSFLYVLLKRRCTVVKDFVSKNPNINFPFSYALAILNSYASEFHNPTPSLGLPADNGEEYIYLFVLLKKKEKTL